mmetsp:Transcript_112706/g.319246  ORF Transcript_112706/g.319246 Transcript_112706/m.319246 type:complete len:88 (+) Transcript_112706:1034-1297(+)
MHPMLANAPCLPPAPSLPTGAPPRGRPHVYTGRQGCGADADDDGGGASWGDATSFYGETARRRRPSEGRQLQLIRRVGAVAPSTARC